MNDLKVRKLPDWVVDTHRSRAEAAGRSLEEELRCLLTEAALSRQRDFASDAGAFRERMESKYGTLSDSTAGIVEERQLRG